MGRLQNGEFRRGGQDRDPLVVLEQSQIRDREPGSCGVGLIDEKILFLGENGDSAAAR